MQHLKYIQETQESQLTTNDCTLIDKELNYTLHIHATLIALTGFVHITRNCVHSRV